MRLSELLEGVSVTKMFQTVYGSMVQTHDVEIHNVRYDSRTVSRGDVFVAIRGLEADGHRYLQDVVGKKVKAVIIENDSALPDSLCMHEGIVKIVVPDTRRALSRVSANFFRHPSKEMHVIGVTGTNGKTTTTYVLESIIKTSGQRAGLIGTIEYRVGDEAIDAHHTTPESYELHEVLRKMADAGCSHAVMEVSSHALEQHRVDDVRFSSAVFTNLTQDHLDYHHTMESYCEAKHRLFLLLDKSASAITNADSEYGSTMIAGTKANTIRYGTREGADFVAENVRATMHTTSFTVRHKNHAITISSHLVGRFNVSNILAAYACAYAAKFDTNDIKRGIGNLRGVRGRFETVIPPDAYRPRGWIAVIDYSHTPDALENVLKAIREIKRDEGRVVTVFGCGGDRDRAKRPVMGMLAQRYSDLVIVTSDNPRTEDPDAIIDDIMKGMQTSTGVRREVDRKKAIEYALSEAGRDDVILIAGKGHETYQILGKTRIHFNDREIVEKWIQKYSTTGLKNSTREP
jgi:UDP-N-acetylmuramoyl-L-alanyl-D-glutamate--2,6-diaminopimelate ligase